MKKRHRLESGQALILIVLTIVGMLGFTALAMDGGRVYADRRFAQNGADAASLAAAGAAAGWLKLAQEAKATGVNGEDWSCGSAKVTEAIGKGFGEAVIIANQNNFTITPSGFNANGNIVGANCEDVNGQYIDFRVSITMDTQTSFAHFVYQGPVQNTVDAITRVYPRAPVAAGHSIISLTDDCAASTKGTRFSGSGYVYIDGGGIFSNSCIRSDGASGEVHIISGTASHDASYPYNGQPIIDPPPVAVNYEFKPIFPYPGVGCVGTDNPPITVSGSNYTLTPGRYTSDVIISGGGSTPIITMEPGLYCFDDGAGFRVNNGDLSGNGVTFYFKDDAGGFDTAGNGIVTLYAPVEPCDDTEPGYWNSQCDPAVPNLLIYVEADNSNPVSLGGNSASNYEGTVYAEKAPVDIGGTASELTTVGVQVIADTVRIHGTVSMTITYDDSLVYHTPNKLNLEK